MHIHCTYMNVNTHKSPNIESPEDIYIRVHRDNYNTVAIRHSVTYDSISTIESPEDGIIVDRVDSEPGPQSPEHERKER